MNNGSERSAFTRAESVYNYLTGYRLALQYIEGKSVADIRWEETEVGISLLARHAATVTIILGENIRTLDEALPVPRAENVNYRRVELPDLPYPDGYFDAVVALQVIENLEQPEHLVREAKRTLNRDGVFVVSTPDKQTHSNDRNHRNPVQVGEMYTLQFQGMLGANFEHVRMYRQGVVAGGAIFSKGDWLSSTPVETFDLSAPVAHFGSRPLTTSHVLAVCSDAEIPGENERSIVLFDDERTVFDENTEYREDVDLLRAEIANLEKTEVQAFQEERREKADLIAQNKRLTNRLESMENALTPKLLASDNEYSCASGEDPRLLDDKEFGKYLRNRQRTARSSRMNSLVPKLSNTYSKLH